MAATLEDRVSELEAKMEKVLAAEKRAKSEKPETPWWEQMFGKFKDSPHFDGAIRRGADYRKAQPNAADNPEAIVLDES